ncbi:T9SS type A sorting domain-containing protein, partial [Maribellus sp. CM-23]|uniref:T9SS type A sorting domain-containing protein n=1 Tax=Maribellus sp. CM-23 TaxID=2781026 RepID=UPI001F2DD62E
DAGVTASDNCDGDISSDVVCTPGQVEGGDCDKSQTFMYTVMDECGNSDTAYVTYTWKVDVTDPVLADVPTGGDLGCNPEVLPSCDQGVTASDNCDGDISSDVVCTPGQVEGGDCDKSQTFMYTVMDECGNSDTAYVTYTWKVDLTDPEITAPDDQEYCNGEFPEYLVASWYDECSGAGTDTAWMSVQDDTNICEQMAYYYFEVTDDCGNVARDTTTIVNRIDKYDNCETAFGKMAGEGANCFLDNGFDRWGWSNYIQTGGQDTTIYLTLWAGAAHCETEKGDSVGTVQVTYDAAGSSLTVEYMIADGYAMSEAHTYVGCGMFPLQKKGKSYVPTVAPGQFTANSGSLEHSKNIVVTFTNVDENFYVIAHAVTCEEVCRCSERPGVDDGNTYDAVFDDSTCDNNTAAEQTNSKGKKSASTIETNPTVESELRVYPNPFSDKVNIEFVSPVSGHAVLEIHNMVGQRVATLIDQYIEAGVEQKVQYRPDSESSGIYLYRLNVEGNIQIGKIIYRNE